MDILPGPVSYAEGEALRDSIDNLIRSLADVDTQASTAWTKNNVAASQNYRLQTQSSVKKAIDLLRSMQPLAAYVGGDRADELKRRTDMAAAAAVSYRDSPTENGRSEMALAFVDAIRNSFDLVMLGSATNAAREYAERIAAASEQTVNSRLADTTASMDALAAAIRQEIDAATGTIRQEAERLSKEVAARGEETVARTRKAVAGALLDDAQAQFAEAQRWFNWQVVIWAALSIVSVAAFLWTTASFLRSQQLPSSWSWQLAFYAGMRLVLLGGIAAIASFSLRMLKGQIALAQLNAHRTRVARSMPGLLEVAPESERLAVLQAIIRSIVGVKESVLADSSSESLLSTLEAIERMVKTVKPGG